MRLRTLLIGAVGVVSTLVVVLVAVTVFLARADLQPYVGRVEAAAKDATGRELRIGGPVGVKLSLFPTVAAENVRFENARWGSRPDLATAKRVEVQLALLPLLTGNVVVRRLTLVAPDVLLEENARGERNWDLARPAAKGAPPREGSGGSPVAIRQVRIDDGVLVHRQAKPARVFRTEMKRLDADASDGYDALEFTFKGALNGVPLEIRGDADGIKRALGGAAPAKVDLKAAAGGARVALKGNVPLGGAGLDGLDARVEAEAQDLQALGRIAATSLPHLPPLKLQVRARAEQGALALEGLDGALGKTRVKGSARVGLTGERRPIDVKLESPLVDLRDFAAAKPAGAAPPPPGGDGRVIPNYRFPLEALKALEGSANLRVAKLTLADGRTLDGVALRSTFKGGRIDAERLSLRLDGGELALSLRGDATSGKTLRLESTLEAKQVPLAVLAGLMGVAASAEGAPTDATIRLAGSGADLRALAAGASGDVRVVVGPGRIRTRALQFGADVTELLTALNPARQTDEFTNLRCAVVRFPVKNGVATIDNGIGAESDKVRVIGGGTVDLRTEKIELGFRPAASTGLGVGAGSLARFARVTGTLGDPRIGLDMASTAGAAAAAGAAVMTGGLSLLAGGLLLSGVPDNPCQVALTGAPKAAPKQESGGGSLFDPIKRLFGN
jgi:uncharacterized protein involved in outer membrane biogenesis